MKRKFTFMILAMLFAILGSGAKAWGQATASVELCTSWNQTLAYATAYTHDYTIDNLNGSTTTMTLGVLGVYRQSNANTYFQMNKKDGYFKNTTKLPGKITKIETTWSAAKGPTKCYFATNEEATSEDKTVTVTAATSVTYTPPTDADYYFFNIDVKTGSGSAQMTSCKVYYEAKPAHTLTFSATNGSITAMNGETVIESGDDVEEGAELDITATANDWYKFSGWNVSGTGSTLGSTTANPTTFTMGTADATLTATFAACVVTVSSNNENWGIALYDDESHTISTAAEDGYRISSTEPYTIAPADAATLTAGDDDTFVVSGVKDQDVEITINFEALPSVAYTVFFDGNDHGTPASESIPEASAGAGVTLPDCTPNTGYQFVGWATTNTATEPDAGVVGATYYPSADITLYAVYNSVYTINYMVNGVNTDAQENVLEGTPLVFPEVSAPDADHVFRGWVTEAIEGTTDTEPAYVNTTDLTATQNITYYAVFAEKSGSEPAEQKTQTLQYDTWTYYGSTTDKETYRLFHSGSYIESAEFDLSKLSKVIVYGGSFGGSSYNSLTIGDGTNTWKSVTVSGSSQTGTNTYTDGTPLSGTGKLRVTSNSGTASGTGVRISKVEIFTMEGGYTYSNFCTTIVTKILTSISLSGEYPTEFWKGETFSHEGMIVTAHYSNAPDADVTSKATFSTPDMTTAGEQEVTVTYDTKQAKYNITVKTIVNTQETAYTVAEAKTIIDANPAELATTKVYVKGTISQVDSYNSTYHSITYWISEDGTTTNQFEVYSGKNLNNTDFASKDDVKVGDDVVVYGIIKKFNSTYEFDKNNYLVSHLKVSTLSIEDITVEIDGDINPVITTNVPSYTIAYSSDNEEVVLADGDEMVTMGLGSATITATLTADGYKEATTTFEVTVIKALESIAVKTAPTTTSYKAGDFFDPTGLVITATYSDATTEDVPYAENEDKFTFEPSLETALTTEDESVTITYADKASTTQEISVRELDTYDITWMANGEEHTTTQVTEGDALVLPETNPDNVGDMVFQGWINTENYYDASEAPEYIVPDEIIPTEAMTFYAVYAKESAGETTSVTKDIIDEAGLTVSVTLNADNNPYQMGELPITLTGIKGTSNFPALNYNATNGTDLRFYKGTTCGVTFATTNNSTITKIEFKKNTSTASTLGSTFSANVGTLTGNVWTGSAGSVTISYSADATFKEQMYIINVTYSETSPSIYSNFCTTVKPIEEDKTISENTVWNGNITINEHTVTIGSGAVLTVNGALINTDPENLIIEDGAQLIVNNAGVQATVKKNIAEAITRDSKWSDWYTISSPLADDVEFTEVENLIPGNDVTNTSYDLYRLNEAAGMWENSRIEDQSQNEFTTIDKGRGYLYARKDKAQLEFKGVINVADVENVNLTMTADKGKGFNLIGNPFMQNITLDNVDGTAELAGGFYVLSNEGDWGTKLTGDIKPLQGFLVQAKTTGNVTISKPTAAPSKGERSEQNTNIEMIVSNSNHRDNAFAVFGEGIGLNKVNHRNAEAPMLYVPQDGEKFAIAFMDENTTVFPLNFKAMTTGKYSISLKATDDINTLVLVDNMTGEETNMLLENSYSFNGSPADSEGRFTVKLSISHSNGQSDNEHFVYQNGSELVVNGEGSLQIFDVLGRVVISEEVHGQTVYVGNLSEGAYIVRMTGNEIKTQKIIIR